MVKIKVIQLNPDASGKCTIPVDLYGIVALRFVNRTTGAVALIDYRSALYYELFKKTLVSGQVATAAYFATGNELFLADAFNRNTVIDISGDQAINNVGYLHIVEYIKTDD